MFGVSVCVCVCVCVGGGRLGSLGCKLVLPPVLPKQNCYPKAETSALLLPRVYKAAALQVKTDPSR